jgi:hypothetical protein
MLSQALHAQHLNTLSMLERGIQDSARPLQSASELELASESELELESESESESELGLGLERNTPQQANRRVYEYDDNSQTGTQKQVPAQIAHSLPAAVSNMPPPFNYKRYYTDETNTQETPPNTPKRSRLESFVRDVKNAVWVPGHSNTNQEEKTGQSRTTNRSHSPPPHFDTRNSSSAQSRKDAGKPCNCGTAGHHDPLHGSSTCDCCRGSHTPKQTNPHSSLYSRQERRSWVESNFKIHPAMSILITNDPKIRILHESICFFVGSPNAQWKYGTGKAHSTTVQMWNPGHPEPTTSFPTTIDLWKNVPVDERQSAEGANKTTKRYDKKTTRMMPDTWPDDVDTLRNWIGVFVHPRMVAALDTAMYLVSIARAEIEANPRSTKLLLWDIFTDTALKIPFSVVVQYALGEALRRLDPVLSRGTTTFAESVRCDTKAALRLLSSATKNNTTNKWTTIFPTWKAEHSSPHNRISPPPL